MQRHQLKQAGSAFLVQAQNNKKNDMKEHF
jgi:hypothetical protein